MKEKPAEEPENKPPTDGGDNEPPTCGVYLRQGPELEGVFVRQSASESVYVDPAFLASKVDESIASLEARPVDGKFDVVATLSVETGDTVSELVTDPDYGGSHDVYVVASGRVLNQIDLDSLDNTSVVLLSAQTFEEASEFVALLSGQDTIS